MQARGKHNWTAPRKVSLISMLTASTRSQSVSRSSRRTTSSCEAGSTHVEHLAGIQVAQDRVVAVPLAPCKLINPQKTWRGQRLVLLYAQSSLGELGTSYRFLTPLHETGTDAILAFPHA